MFPFPLLSPMRPTEALLIFISKATDLFWGIAYILSLHYKGRISKSLRENTSAEVSSVF